MATSDAVDATGDEPGPSTGGSIGIAIAQLVLIPVLAIVGFGFLFVGVGLSPQGGEVITGRDMAVLVLYGFIGLTLLVLLIGAPTLLIARGSDRPALARKAARIPLIFAGISALILVGLAIAGFVFDQVAAV